MVWYCKFWRSRNRFADTSSGFLLGSGWIVLKANTCKSSLVPEEAIWQASELPYCKVCGFLPLAVHVKLCSASYRTLESAMGGIFSAYWNIFKVWWGQESAVPGVTVCQCQQLGALTYSASFSIAGVPSWLGNALVIMLTKMKLAVLAVSPEFIEFVLPRHTSGFLKRGEAQVMCVQNFRRNRKTPMNLMLAILNLCCKLKYASSFEIFCIDIFLSLLCMSL